MSRGRMLGIFVVIVLALLGLCFFSYTGMYVVEPSEAYFDWNESWDLNGSFVRVSLNTEVYDYDVYVLVNQVFLDLSGIAFNSTGVGYVDLVVNETVVDSMSFYVLDNPANETGPGEIIEDPTNETILENPVEEVLGGQEEIIEIMDESNPPTHSTPILNSTLGTNLTTENLTVYNQSTDDLDGDPVKNIYNWYKDGGSITVLNMPMEGEVANHTNVRDYSGYGNNGTNYSAVWNRTGGYDGFGAFEFDGASDHRIVVGDSVELGITEDITISMWMRPGVTISPSSPDHVLLEKGDCYFMEYDTDSANAFQFAIKQSDTPYSASTITDTFNAGEWYHVVGVHDSASNKLKIYVNGTLEGSTDFDGTIDDDDLALYLGTRDSLAGDYNGAIDDLIIFNRSLSDEQIQALYLNQTNRIVQQETKGREVWNATVTPNDGFIDGETIWSNSLNISALGVVNISLNSTGTNLTTDNVTITYDLSNGSNKAIINWYRNGTSITVLNMPFDISGSNENSSNIKDYSGEGNNGSIVGASWNRTWGYDKNGTYYFDGGDYIEIGPEQTLNLDGSASFEFRLYLEQLNDNYHCIMSKRDVNTPPDGCPYNLCFDKSGSNYYFNYWTKNGGGGWNSQQFTSYDFAPQTDRWLHLVITNNGTSAVLYVDGDLKEIISFTKGSQNNDRVTLGMADPATPFYLDGFMDEVRVYNHTLSDDQIKVLYENRTDIVVSEETNVNEIWNATVTPVVAGYEDGDIVWSDSLTIVEDVNNAPTHTTPILNSTLGTNLTTENLTVYNQSTDDVDNDNVKNIYNWYKDGTSIAVLNMPFEGGSLNGTTAGPVINATIDYSGNENNATVYDAVWRGDKGYDGTGAYYFDGAGDYLDLGNHTSLDLNETLTITAWIYRDNAENYQGIVTKCADSGCGVSPYYQYNLYTDNANNLRGRVGAGNCALNSNTTITLDSWTFVSMTWDGSDLKLYQDGRLTGINSGCSGPISSGFNNTKIGSDSAFWDGYIDEVMIFDRVLTLPQLESLHQNRTDLIVSGETHIGEVWNVTVTPNDGSIDGETLWTNSVTINSSNNLPTHSTPILNSTLGTNLTTENLTVYNQSTDDLDGDPVKNIYNWYKDGTSIAVLNMPMEGEVANHTNVKDYSGNGNNGTNVSAVWNGTGGYDGYGAFEFDSDSSQYIDVGSNTSLNLTYGGTVMAWAKFGSTYRVPVLSKEVDQSNVNYILSTVSGNQFFFGFENGGTQSGANSISTATTGVWYHLVGTFDGDILKLYINGELNASAKQNTLPETAGTLNIGKTSWWATPYYMNGTVDEVLIFDRVLTEEQIREIYETGYDKIDYRETKTNESWTCEITPNDGSVDGEKLGNSLIVQGVVGVSDIAINSSGSNITSDNITVTYTLVNSSTDAVVNWYRNGTSITGVNMIFEDESSDLFAKDFSGYGNNISSVGGDPDWNATIGFNLSGGFELDGSSDVLYIADDSSVDFSNEITIEARVKLNVKNKNQGIVYKGSHATSHGVWYISYIQSSSPDGIYFKINNNGLSVTPSSDLDTGKWYHIVATYDGQTATTYLDGVVDGTDAYGSPTALSTDANDIQIGRYYASDRYLNGVVDNVRIYNISLTADQVKALYDNRTDLIVSSMTALDEIWNVTITPTNDYENTDSQWGNGLTILEEVSCTDADGDGWNASGVGCGTADCDDSDPIVRPIVDGDVPVNGTLNNLTTSIIMCNGTYNFDIYGAPTLARAIQTRAHNLLIDCNGSYLLGNATARGIAIAPSHNNITIRNCVIDNFTGAFRGSDFNFGDDVFIDNVWVKQTINQTIAGNQADNWTVYNSTLEGNKGGDVGIDMYATTTLNFTHNKVKMRMRITSTNSVVRSNQFDYEVSYYCSGSNISYNNYSGGVGLYGAGGNTYEYSNFSGDLALYCGTGGLNFTNNTVRSDATSFQMTGDLFRIEDNVFEVPDSTRNAYIALQPWSYPYMSNFLFKDNWMNATGTLEAIRLPFGVAGGNLTFINNTIYTPINNSIRVSNFSGYMNISYNNFVRGGRGVELGNVHDIGEIKIYANNFTNITNMSILLYDFDNVNISDNYFYKNGFGIYFDNVTNVDITYNNFTNTWFNGEDGVGTAITGRNITYSRFTKNYFYEGEDSEINIGNSTYNNFTYNVITDTSGGTNFQVSGVGHYNNFMHNYFMGGSSPAMSILGDNTTIVNTTVYDQSMGIFAFGSGINVSSNNITLLTSGYTYAGLNIYIASNGYVSRNNVSHTDIGIYLNGATNMTVFENYVYNMSREGIHILNSDDAVVFNNNVTLADNFAIVLNSTDDALIYNNYFNAVAPAWDNNTNYWNTTEQTGPSIIGGTDMGGNYYSNYTGYDHDGDGIGDNYDYGITGGALLDYLPLILGWGNTAPTHSTPILNSTLGTNLTSENLTVYNQSTADLDNDPIKNIYNWYRNGTSITVLNLPMEGDIANHTNVKDYSGYGNNGTNVSAEWNRTGGYDGFGAFEFNGNNTYIEISDSNSLDFGTGEFSLNFWMKNVDTNLSGNTQLVGKRQSGGGNYEVQINNGDLEFYVEGTGQSALNLRPGFNVSEYLGDWIFITLDRNETAVGLYVNGILNISGASVHNVDNNNPFIIGKDSDANVEYFNGTIDDILLFNRSLSPNQILALHQNRTNFIHSDETRVNETWNATVTPNDGYIDGETLWSNSLVIVAGNAIPTVRLNLTSYSATNLSTEDIYTNWTIVDLNGDIEQDNETKWYKDEVLQSGLNNYSLIDDGNLSDLEVWKVSVRVYDGTDWSNWTNASITLEAASPAPVPVPTPTGGGGGGGGPGTAEAEDWDYGLDVEPSSLSYEMTKNEALTDSLTFTNLMVFDQDVELQVSGVREFVDLEQEEFTLERDEVKDVEVFIISGEDLGTFTGNVGVQGNNTHIDVPVIIEVESLNVLFDASIDLPLGIDLVSPGDTIPAQITVFSVGSPRKVDVILNYYLKDMDNNILWQKSETLAVEDQISFEDFLEIPSDLRSGSYVLALDVVYSTSVATSSTMFTVMDEERAMISFEKNQTLLLFLIVLMVILIAGVLVLHYAFLTRWDR